MTTQKKISAIEFSPAQKALKINTAAIEDEYDATAILEVVFDIFKIHPKRNLRLIKLLDHLSTNKVEIKSHRRLTFDQTVSVTLAICEKWDSSMESWIAKFAEISSAFSQTELNWNSDIIESFLSSDIIAEQGLTQENINSLIDLILSLKPSVINA